MGQYVVWVGGQFQVVFVLEWCWCIGKVVCEWGVFVEQQCSMCVGYIVGVDVVVQVEYCYLFGWFWEILVYVQYVNVEVWCSGGFGQGFCLQFGMVVDCVWQWFGVFVDLMVVIGYYGMVI